MLSVMPLTFSALLQALYANEDDVKACLMRIKTLMMGEESARDVPDSELEEIPVPAGMTAGERH